MKKLTLLFFVMSITYAFGQKSNPDHTYNLGGKIDFFNLSESGVSVLAFKR